jgi:ribosomal protein S19
MAKLFLVKNLKKKKKFLFKISGLIPALLQGTFVFIRRGIFFRKLYINNYLIGQKLGNYLESRKPFSRVFKKKRR